MHGAILATAATATPITDLIVLVSCAKAEQFRSVASSLGVGVPLGQPVVEGGLELTLVGLLYLLYVLHVKLLVLPALTLFGHAL